MGQCENIDIDYKEYMVAKNDSETDSSKEIEENDEYNQETDDELILS
ncbi:18876_t:CDS:1, partial [Racocetra fulgida]